MHEDTMAESVSQQKHPSHEPDGAEHPVAPEVPDQRTNDDDNDGDDESPTIDSTTDPRPSNEAENPELMKEIRALKDRLRKLKAQATEGLADDTGPDTAASTSEGDTKLRKHFRRARFAKKWTRRVEKEAKETSDERSRYGRRGQFFTHLAKDGTSLRSGSNCVFSAHPTRGLPIDDEDEMFQWDGYTPGPRTSISPMFGLRPHYSRKLGPPTQWDVSDSEEWDSDDSTKTKDFNYFRARLRGDFEWELDRLTAQRERYRRHKAKRNDQNKEETRWDSNSAEPTVLEKKARTPEKEALPLITYLEWRQFEAAASIPRHASYAIQVLKGEPEITEVPIPWPGMKKDELKDPRGMLEEVSKLEVVADQEAGRGLSWNQRTGTPERIRINSKQIYDLLSSFHSLGRLPYFDTPTPKIVMQRPFRMLMYYEDRIREEYQRLALSAAKTNTGPAPMPLPKSDETMGEASDTESDSVGPDTGPSSKTGEHMECLVTFINEHIVKTREHLNSAGATKFSFPDLWYLFKPGDFVLANDGKQAYRITKVVSHTARSAGWADRWNFANAESQSGLRIHCVYVHFDGVRLGPVERHFRIARYSGQKHIASLPIYPLRYHVMKNVKLENFHTTTQFEDLVSEEVTKLRHTLIERGKSFVEAAGVKHMFYAGPTVDTRDDVESQVMIDFASAFSAKGTTFEPPDFVQLIGTADDDSDSDSNSVVISHRHDISQRGDHEECEGACCVWQHHYDDKWVEKHRSRDFIQSMMADLGSQPYKLPPVTLFPRQLSETTTEENSLTDDDFLIMSYTVLGFILRDRTWAQLDLAYLKDLHKDTVLEGDDDSDADPTAFGQLVLPAGHKTMILSLISQHFRNKASQRHEDQQYDIVRGKGKGLIILLHGAPGVGKTTTAEGVAEKFRKPLFQITCGDLGGNASEVEASLRRHFDLANAWECILLLDEADVFLAQRRPEDFQRNGMVAVFLRVLEYYSGILFLTTNRIGDFDEAFASRIHMSLYYPALNSASTTQIFRLNLRLIQGRYKEKGRKLTIDEGGIVELVGEYWHKHKDARWNGRQIRNACQTALALAEFDAQPKGSKYDLKVKSDAEVKLEVAHLKTVSDAYLDFMKYLTDVYGADAHLRAKEYGVRALESRVMEGLAGSPGTPRNRKPRQPFRMSHRQQEQQPQGGQSYAEYGRPVHHQHSDSQRLSPQPALYGQVSGGMGGMYVQNTMSPEPIAQFQGYQQQVQTETYLQPQQPGAFPLPTPLTMQGSIGVHATGDQPQGAILQHPQGTRGQSQSPLLQYPQVIQGQPQGTLFQHAQGSSGQTQSPLPQYPQVSQGQPQGTLLQQSPLLQQSQGGQGQPQQWPGAYATGSPEPKRNG